jgi:hypothetical protein
MQQALTDLKQAVMAKRARGDPRRGDIFELATPDARFGYGLVVEGGGCPYRRAEAAL